ncbi:MAG: hypothetical protein K2O34_12820 [Acetatifactor sp.]|nr:hypothetical protein [Acetatifactor sp.]
MNADGSRVAALLNRTEKSMSVNLVENGEGVYLTLDPHTILYRNYGLEDEGIVT